MKPILILLFGCLLLSSCVKNQSCENSISAEENIPFHEPMVYTLVDKYVDHLKEKVSPLSLFSKNGYDSLYFNILIRFEKNDTLLTIYGSPFEEYYYVKDYDGNATVDDVFLLKREKQSIILYVNKPEQKPFVELLAKPSALLDVKDYVVNHIPEHRIDMDASTYIYHQEGKFGFLKPTY